MKHRTGSSPSRQAEGQTDGQTDGHTQKASSKYIWHSDVIPPSDVHTHARVCLKVRGRWRVYVSLRNTCEKKLYQCRHASVSPTFDYFLSLPPFLYFCLMILGDAHLSIPYSVTHHLFLLSPSHRSLWPFCSRKKESVWAYDMHLLFKLVSFLSSHFFDIPFVFSLAKWLLEHSFFIAFWLYCVLCDADRCMFHGQDQHNYVFASNLCNMYVSKNETEKQNDTFWQHIAWLIFY